MKLVKNTLFASFMLSILCLNACNSYIKKDEVSKVVVPIDASLRILEGMDCNAFPSDYWAKCWEVKRVSMEIRATFKELGVVPDK